MVPRWMMLAIPTRSRARSGTGWMNQLDSRHSDKHVHLAERLFLYDHADSKRQPARDVDGQGVLRHERVHVEEEHPRAAEDKVLRERERGSAVHHDRITA